LVFIYTSSGWEEFFPMRTEKARCLLREIIPRFGIPGSAVSIGSAFVAEVIQLMTKGLGITWKLPPEFRKSGTCESNPKITVGKNISGVPSAVGSITTHSITQD
jgi:hypothetical protein